MEVGRAEVARWHKQLIGSIFPELGAYLRDDTLDVLAGNLGVTVDELNASLKAYFRPVPPLPQLRKWFREYSQLTGRTKDCLKALLERRGANAALEEVLRRGPADDELFLALFGSDVVTLTGRVRGRLPFGQARAAEYLDLADDAAKSALFSLADAGQVIVAFAGNTSLIEVDPAEPDDVVEAVKGRVCRGADEVLGEVPSACEVEFLEAWPRPGGRDVPPRGRRRILAG